LKSGFGVFFEQDCGGCIEQLANKTLMQETNITTHRLDKLTLETLSLLENLTIENSIM